MSLSDPREQLLANLKCLYGSDVEVLTLCVDTPCDKYQAVAMRFDSFTTTWTKFLHGEPNCISTRDAIDTLLAESERELAKLLSANGNIVPFQGIMVQTLTLRRGQRRDSSAGNSMASEFAFVATPGSALSDAVPDESVHEEHPAEVAAPKEPLVDEAPVDKAPVEEAVVEDVNEMCLAEEPVSISKELEPLDFGPGPVSQESETASFDWSVWSIYKDKEKKKTKVTFDETQPVEEYPPDIPAEEPPAEGRVEKSQVEGKHPTEEVCSADDIIEEVPACQPQPDAPPLEDLSGWGSFTATKNDKKKKSRKSIEKEMSTPSPEPEPAEDFGWDFSSVSKKKKKGKLSPPEPDPEPEPVEDFGWNFSSVSKKKKKGKLSPPELEPVSDPVEEFEPKLEELPLAPSSPPLPAPSESQSGIGYGVGGNLRPQAPLPPESVGHSTSAPFLTAAASTDITTDTLQVQVARSRRTVVFTLQFPNEISNKPLQVMATIADNSRTAIIDTVNSYLDSKSMLKGKQGQRKLEIKYGVGRNGDVDLSTLEETMWPEYLDYFRQYTRIPELTVDVMDY